MNICEKQIIADVICDFKPALETLDRYDHEQFAFPKSLAATAAERITYEDAMEAIAVLKEMFNDSDIFGTEKDASFKSSLGQIYQTFDGKELYPTVEIKAAMLLYLVVKNHSFVDGNKRIAAFVFSLVLIAKRHPLQSGWLEEYCRRNTRGAHAPHRRKQTRRKRNYGETRDEPVGDVIFVSS